MGDRCVSRLIPDLGIHSVPLSLGAVPKDCWGFASRQTISLSTSGSICVIWATHRCRRLSRSKWKMTVIHGHSLVRSKERVEIHYFLHEEGIIHPDGAGRVGSFQIVSLPSFPCTLRPISRPRRPSRKPSFARTPQVLAACLSSGAASWRTPLWGRSPH
jgi:hypothetical protein